MSELRVRDHSQPCGHNEASLLFDVDAWVCDRWDCPGGKEIVLRRVDSIGQHGTTLKIVSPRMWVEVVKE